MWYLQIDILIRIIVACVLLALTAGLSRMFFKKEYATKLFLIADLLILAYVSWQLCVFYAAYTVLTYLLILWLYRIRRGRKGLFVLFCFLCAAPFFYVRAAGFFPYLPVWVALTGIAFTMLKAIDGLFFVYYAEKAIPLYIYANYMLFFPTLTSGPIFRYRDFEKTFLSPMPITSELVESCVKRFIRGMFKKVVAVTLIGICITHLMTLPLCWYVSLLLILCSYLTLYFDLSGYSDIAIAVGKMTGLNVPENFKKPWTAASFTQFWRKWHVTLSDWIREHIFVVLSGKKLNKYLSALIAFCTLMVMELWHGFTLPYIIAGVYNGGLLAIENLFGLTTVDKRHTNKWIFWLRCLAVDFLFGINALLFTADLPQIKAIVWGLFHA